MIWKKVLPVAFKYGNKVTGKRLDLSVGARIAAPTCFHTTIVSGQISIVYRQRSLAFKLSEFKPLGLFHLGRNCKYDLLEKSQVKSNINETNTIVRYKNS